MPAETFRKSFGRAPGNREDDEEAENEVDARVVSEQPNGKSGARESHPREQATPECVGLLSSLTVGLNLQTATVGFPMDIDSFCSIVRWHSSFEVAFGPVDEDRERAQGKPRIEVLCVCVCRRGDHESSNDSSQRIIVT